MSEDVGVDRAEGGVRAILEAVGERGQDLPFEVRPRQAAMGLSPLPAINAARGRPSKVMPPN
jgi:hypothetical protein